MEYINNNQYLLINKSKRDNMKIFNNSEALIKYIKNNIGKQLEIISPINSLLEFNDDRIKYVNNNKCIIYWYDFESVNSKHTFKIINSNFLMEEINNEIMEPDSNRFTGEKKIKFDEAFNSTNIIKKIKFCKKYIGSHKRIRFITIKN